MDKNGLIHSVTPPSSMIFSKLVFTALPCLQMLTPDPPAGWNAANYRRSASKGAIERQDTSPIIALFSPWQDETRLPRQPFPPRQLAQAGPRLSTSPQTPFPATSAPHRQPPPPQCHNVSTSQLAQSAANKDLATRCGALLVREAGAREETELELLCECLVAWLLHRRVCPRGARVSIPAFWGVTGTWQVH